MYLQEHPERLQHYIQHSTFSGGASTSAGAPTGAAVSATGAEAAIEAEDLNYTNSAIALDSNVGTTDGSTAIRRRLSASVVAKESDEGWESDEELPQTGELSTLLVCLMGDTQEQQLLRELRCQLLPLPRRDRDEFQMYLPSVLLPLTRS